MSQAVLVSRREPVGGVVAAFDEREGLGRLALDDGRSVRFHATQLLDGTRRIDVGRRVTAVIVAWHRGELEATEVADA